MKPIIFLPPARYNDVERKLHRNRKLRCSTSDDYSGTAVVVKTKTVLSRSNITVGECVNENDGDFARQKDAAGDVHDVTQTGIAGRPVTG